MFYFTLTESKKAMKNKTQKQNEQTNKRTKTAPEKTTKMERRN